MMRRFNVSSNVSVWAHFLVGGGLRLSPFLHFAPILSIHAILHKSPNFYMRPKRIVSH